MISFVLLADTIRIENEKNRRKKNGKLIENVEEQTRECGGGERETERERGNGRFWIRHEPKSFNIAQCKWVAQRRSQRQLDGDGDAHLPSSGSSDQSHEWDAAEQLAYMAIRCRAWRKMACGFWLSLSFFAENGFVSLAKSENPTASHPTYIWHE